MEIIMETRWEDVDSIHLVRGLMLRSH